MGLADRLVRPPGGGSTPGGEPARATPAGGTLGVDLGDLRRRVHDRLIAEVGPALYDNSLDAAALRQRVAEVAGTVVGEEAVAITASEEDLLVRDVCDDVAGFGPIDSLLGDPTVTEIMCNGPHEVYVERAGRIEATDVHFLDAGHLRRVIDKIVGGAGRRVDESSPLCDARLPDGSRVNAVVAPVAVGGPFLTVRKFAGDRLTAADLVQRGSVGAAVLDFLAACVAGRASMVVSGGTGSGKTTLLNVLSSFIPDGERIVTVEDAKELQLAQRHVVALESRPPNLEGRGEVTIRDLVRNSLRMRPDRIIVGEVRSGEALDMLQAMNTGHAGSLTSVHANTPRDAIARLETLVLMAGFDLPLRAIREQLAAAVDLVVQMERGDDGVRRVTRVVEVQGMESGVVVTAELFAPAGDSPQTLQATGVRPRVAERLGARGIALPGELFTPGLAPVGRVGDRRWRR